MRHKYSSIPFVEYSAKMDEMCAWLEKLGINYSVTRVGKYKELFSCLATHQKADTLSEFNKEYSLSDWINAVHETGELTRIYEGLFRKNDENLISRLRDSLRGHELYVLEKPDKSGRDFSFELAIAADFSRAGYEIDFGHEADLKVSFNNRDLYVECKRLKSFNRVNRRIKEGLKQLHRRYSDSHAPTMARGLLVLSIGKLVNADLGLLEANNPAELGEKALYQNRIFIDKFRELWQSKVDKRTLGVIVVLDTPSRLTGNQQLVTCHEVSITDSWPVGTENDLLLREIGSKAFEHFPGNVVTS